MRARDNPFRTERVLDVRYRLASGSWADLLSRFDALGLVGFNINPHYKEADPLMAAGSETRDDRIREYHVVNRNPVVGLEEGALVRVENGRATALGTARIKLFRRGVAPRWYTAGARLPVK